MIKKYQHFMGNPIYSKIFILFSKLNWDRIIPIIYLKTKIKETYWKLKIGWEIK